MYNLMMQLVQLEEAQPEIHVAWWLATVPSSYLKNVAEKPKQFAVVEETADAMYVVWRRRKGFELCQELIITDA